GGPGPIYLVYDAPPASNRPIRAGTTRRVGAVQLFPPTYRHKIVTEQVVFDTDKPDVLKALNTPGDRGLLLGVGSGYASVTARDPETGNVSQPLTFRVLDGLTRVIAQQLRKGRVIVDVNGFIGFAAVGIFADGEGPLDLSDVTLVSSNPAVVQVAPGNYL